MVRTSDGDVGERLALAAKLPGRAVCVHGSDEPSSGAMPLSRVDRCMARAIYKIAMDPQVPTAYFGTDTREGLCPGGQAWCGLAKSGPKLKYFISTGTPEFMGGAAEHLKPGPEAAERFFAAPGRITPPARYINLAGSDQVPDGVEVLSYIFIGTAESIRNLGGLVQYVSEDIFTAVLMPGGPTCASMITYAAGMAEHAPKSRGFVGPVDPTGNTWLPPDTMTLAVPASLARTMAQNIEGSFLGKRPQVAFPSARLGLNDPGEH